MSGTENAPAKGWLLSLPFLVDAEEQSREKSEEDGQKSLHLGLSFFSFLGKTSIKNLVKLNFKNTAFWLCPQSLIRTTVYLIKTA